MLDMVNMLKDDVAFKLTKANEDYFVMPFLRNIKAGQKEYYLPERMMAHVKKVEIDLIGTVSENGCPKASGFEYKEGREVDISQEKIHYIPSNPGQRQSIHPRHQEILFRISRTGLILVTNEEIVDVIDGLRVHVDVWPRDLVEEDIARTIPMSIDLSDTEFSIPRALHLQFLLYCSGFYKQSREKPIPLFDDEKQVMQSLNEDILQLSPISYDMELLGQTPVDNGWNY